MQDRENRVIFFNLKRLKKIRVLEPGYNIKLLYRWLFVIPNTTHTAEARLSEPDRGFTTRADNGEVWIDESMNFKQENWRHPSII